MKRMLGVAAVVLVGLLAVVGPGRGAGLTAVEVTTDHESWYHVTPLNSPSALPPAAGVRPPSVPPEVPAVSPTGANRLQVGIVGGVESARTYLKLAAGSIDGEVVGGVMRLPLDLDPGAGSLLPESAGLVACVARDLGIEAEGSFASLPPVDCATMSPALVGEGPDPVLLIDLAPFGFLVQTEGIVLLPAASEITAQDTWRVSIRGADPAEPGQGISATLEVETTDEPIGGDGFDDSPFGNPDFGDSSFRDSSFEDTGFGDSSADGGMFGGSDFSSADGLSPAATGSEPLVQEPLAEEPFTPIGFIDPDFAYSSILLLPLGLIAAFAWFGLNLTRPIQSTL